MWRNRENAGDTLFHWLIVCVCVHEGDVLIMFSFFWSNVLILLGIRSSDRDRPLISCRPYSFRKSGLIVRLTLPTTQKLLFATPICTQNPLPIYLVHSWQNIKPILYTVVQPLQKRFRLLN